MADAVGPSDAALSSETDVDPFCEPCLKDGHLKEAVGYCPTCVEYYCPACIRSHQRFAMTEHHRTEANDKMPKSMADKPVKYKLCNEHSGELRNVYCFGHREVICGKCDEMKHKKCNTKSVIDACKRFSILSEATTFSKEVKKLIDFTKTVKESVDESINDLEEQEQKVLKEAETYRDELIKQIHESYQEFDVMRNNVLKELKSKLSRSMSDLEKIISDLTLIEQYTGIEKHSEPNRFLELKARIDNFLVAAEKVRFLANDTKSVEIKSRLYRTTQPVLESLGKFGEISIQESSLSCGIFPELRLDYLHCREDSKQTAGPTTTNNGDPNTMPLMLTKIEPVDVMLGGEDEPRISGLDVTVDGDIIVADIYNFDIKLFSPSGQNLSFVDVETLGEAAQDVSVISNTEFAVTMNRQIGIIDITHMRLKHVIRSRGYNMGITTYNNHLIITCDSENPDKARTVKMMTMGGSEVWAVTKDTKGENLFERADYITKRCTEAGDFVVVSDWKKCRITILDARSGKVIKVCDLKEKKSFGVTVDDLGNIYVAYISAGESQIGVWSWDMTEQMCVVTGKECVTYPWAMAFDQKQSLLLVTSSEFAQGSNRNYVHRYKVHK